MRPAVLSFPVHVSAHARRVSGRDPDEGGPEAYQASSRLSLLKESHGQRGCRRLAMRRARMEGNDFTGRRGWSVRLKTVRSRALTAAPGSAALCNALSRIPIVGHDRIGEGPIVDVPL